MFKLRLITGFCLIVFALTCIYFLPFWLFVVLVSLMTLLAAWEWSLLLDCRHLACRFLFVLSVLALMILVWQAPLEPLLFICLFWWIIALFFIWTYPKTAELWSKGVLARVLMGFLTLVPCWLSINVIRSAQNGREILLFMLVLVWGADSGAYFAGKLWGKRKLQPFVSPKKTWQGLYGGLLLSLIIAVIGCLLLNIALPSWPSIILLSLLTVLFSVGGDLLESMLKRQRGIKDTGNYLPGHGGLLDRIDSLTAAAPIFLLGCMALGLFASFL